MPLITPPRQPLSSALAHLWELRVALALLAVLGLVALLRGARQADPPPSVAAHFVQGGIAVGLTVDAVDPERRGASLREGDDATFRFTITDASTGTPLTRLFPVAWVDRQREGEARGEGGCRDKIRTFLEGNLFRRAETDLNEYQVLVLNDDATISVVDPRFGFGGSRLLSMVSLRSPGADWALTGDGRRLFVSMPEARRVAVVDTLGWTVIAEIDAGLVPGPLLLQPDEGYLWVLGESGDRGGPSVSVISTHDLRVEARLGEGGGRRALTLSDDNRTAFLACPESSSVAIIDVRSLAIVRRVEVGLEPVAIAYSPLARAAYVAGRGEGGITVIDADRPNPLARIPAGPDLAGIRFDPRGRLGIAFSTEHDRLQIIDSSDNRVIQSAVIGGGPDQVTFSDTLAYVRCRASETITMIPLAQAGAAGERTPAADFPGGQAAPGPASIPSSLALAPGGGSMLVANAADRVIYYYKEGMAAPMGHFDAYGRIPRGVLVLDHGLRERAPGVYETSARLGSAGVQDIAFLLDTPRTAHCFTAEVMERERGAGVSVELSTGRRSLAVGAKNRVQVRVRDALTGAPRSGLHDLTVLAYLSPGVWQAREHAEPEGDGVYVLTITPPRAGVYSLVAASPSAGLSFHRSSPLILTAE